MITIYRDTPKPRETDAQWCGYTAVNGHVQRQTSDHLTPSSAAQALGASATEAAQWDTHFGY